MFPCYMLLWVFGLYELFIHFTCEYTSFMLLLRYVRKRGVFSSNELFSGLFYYIIKGFWYLLSLIPVVVRKRGIKWYANFSKTSYIYYLL